MTLPSELRTEIDKIRSELLDLMREARTVDEALRQATNHQASLKASIMLSLDHLDKIDKRLQHP